MLSSTATAACRRRSTSRSRPTRPGSPERAALKARLKAMAAERIDIPLIIGGKEIRTGETATVGDAARSPARARRLAQGDRPSTSQQAIDAARERARANGRTGRGRIAPRCSCKRRRAARRRRGATTLNAATMLGQSKTAFQAEIDAACELIDFWRFNAHYAQELLRRAAAQRPRRCGTSSTTRPLEGFVYAVTPFNFTSIGGNLPTAPALMGNTVIWKPASTRDAVGVLPDEAARGGRAAAGRDQLRAGRRGDDLERAARRTAISPACTSPAAPASSTACGRRSARTCRSYRVVSAHRRRDRRQGLHRRASVGRSAGARRRDRARRLRVPGAEVLGGEPRLRAAVAVERGARSRRRDDRRDQDGRRHATSATSWAR